MRRQVFWLVIGLSLATAVSIVAQQGTWVLQNNGQALIASTPNGTSAVSITQKNASAKALTIVGGLVVDGCTGCGGASVPGSSGDVVCNVSSAFGACDTGVFTANSATHTVSQTNVVATGKIGDGSHYLIKWDGVNGVVPFRDSSDSSYVQVRGGFQAESDVTMEQQDGANGIKWFSGSAFDAGLYRNAAGVLEVNNGTAGTFRDLKLEMLRVGQTTAPTCTSSCGTSPSVSGSDTAMLVTMGASGSPASGFVITFNHTWATAPSCIMQSAKSGMVAGKMPITLAVTTTTVTVTTNGTAPGNSDVYAMHCIGVS